MTDRKKRNAKMMGLDFSKKPYEVTALLQTATGALFELADTHDDGKLHGVMTKQNWRELRLVADTALTLLGTDNYIGIRQGDLTLCRHRDSWTAPAVSGKPLKIEVDYDKD